MKTTESRATDHIAFEIKIDAKDDDGRTFEGFLSTSDLDLGNFLYKDVVHAGAFKRTLSNFKAAKRPYVPLLDNHDRWSIFSVLGHLVDAKEEVEGDDMRLWTKWSIIEGTDGDRVLDRLRPDSVRKMSMGYEPTKFDFEEDAESGDIIRHLREVKLLEGSLVVFPMNPNAETIRESIKYLEGHVTDQAALDRLVADCHGDDLCLLDVKRRAAALLTTPPATDPDEDPPAAPDVDGPAVVSAEKRRELEARGRMIRARNLTTQL